MTEKQFQCITCLQGTYAVNAANAVLYLDDCKEEELLDVSRKAIIYSFILQQDLTCEVPLEFLKKIKSFVKKYCRNNTSNCNNC